MLSDAVKSSTAEMPAAYVSEVGGERLDSETLSADITELTASIDNYQMLLSNEEAKETVSQATVNSIKASINSEMVQRKTLQDKLAKLLAFDATSPTYFSKIPGLASAVDAGLTAAGTVSTSFILSADMSWATAINTNWASYQEAVQAGYQAAVDKVKNGQPLTEADILAIQRYQRNHPDAVIDSDVQKAMEAYDVDKNYQAAVKKAEAGEALSDTDIQAIEAYQKAHPDAKVDKKVEQAKETYTVDRNYQDVVEKIERGEALTEDDVKTIETYAKTNPNKKPSEAVVTALENYHGWEKNTAETILSKSLDPKEWSWATFGKLLDDANEIAIKQGKNLGRVLGAKLQPRDALGRFVKDTNKPRAWLSGKLKGMSNGTSKLIGHGAKFLGFGVSATLEGLDHYSKHKNVGRAISYGAVGGLVALGAGAVAGAIGAAAALPAIGTLAVGIAVGAVASAGLKAAYENIKPVKDVIDGAGDLLNKGGKVVSDGVKSIGKAFSNPIGSLKGAFGW